MTFTCSTTSCGSGRTITITIGRMARWTDRRHTSDCSQKREPGRYQRPRNLQAKVGGGRGIRTPGTVSSTVVITTTAIDHSAIRPTANCHTFLENFRMSRDVVCGELRRVSPTHGQFGGQPLCHLPPIDGTHFSRPGRHVTL